jgi:diguanylate cyclase (GGDEF)-like protein
VYDKGIKLNVFWNLFNLMQEARLNPEAQDLLDQLKQAHLLQKQQVADQFNDGLLLMSAQLTPLLINKTAHTYFDGNRFIPCLLSQIQAYTQKQTRLRFDLKTWCLQQFENDSGVKNESPLLWLHIPNDANEKTTILPVLISAFVIQSTENDPHNLLILIKDQSLQIQAEAQIKLMETSPAGQFITNPHGYITQPNYAFSAYTGLNIETLQQMTYVDWLQNQVVFRVPFGSVMKALLENGYWNGEVQLNPSSTVEYHAVLSLSMLTDHNRNIEHFIGVLQDITDIRHANNEIKRLAYYDNLTGLANRTLLHNQIGATHECYPTSQSYSGLILLDLDSFKMINDTLGYEIGDQLLILVAKKLSGLAESNNLVARLEGDEFAILVKEISQDRAEALTQLLTLAYKVQEAIDDRYTIQNRSLHCTASIGLHLYSKPSLEAHGDELIRYTNMAMHEAKTLGGNQVYQFEERLCEIAQKRLEMLQALNHSELDKEFELYFQAQLDKNGKTVAAETLLRWFHPVLGLVPPGQFIPVAEEGRQIIKIGLWTMHKAFLRAKYWNETYGPLRISINISPIQFHEQGFVELVIGLLKFTQVNPEHITLELTEGVLIRNTNLTLQKIQHLVSLGFYISIDDFGTGYSSLSYLQKLPIHELKIDQSFIRYIPENESDVAIVDSILKLAENKKLTVVAEGVELQDQADFLRQSSPDILIQGYLYSKPVPAAEFEASFLTKSSKT